LQNRFFNFGLATVVGIDCVKSFVGALNIAAKITLFAIRMPVFADIITATKRTT